MAHKEATAEIVREYGPFPSVDSVAGVTFDGSDVWFAGGGRLHALDPKSGATRRTIDTPADAGTAFDGRHLYQLARDRIHKIDPETGNVVSSIPAPAETGNAGLAWVEGKLWVGNHPSKKIHQIDPETGRILRTLESPRPVTGVTFVDGELWHGTWESEQSDIRHIDRETGEVLEVLVMPKGTMVSGLEFDGRDLFYCGGGRSQKVRAVAHPRRAARAPDA